MNRKLLYKTLLTCLYAIAFELILPSFSYAVESLTLVSPPANAVVGGWSGLQPTWELQSVPIGTTSVKSLIDGVVASNQTFAPLNKGKLWDIERANGSHTFALEAYAGTTLVGTTTPITIRYDSKVPLISLTSPSAGTFSGVVTLSADASDSPAGIAQVNFYIDGGMLVGSVSAAPYSVSFDTTLLPDGRYHLMAQANDYAGFSNYSNTVLINIANGRAATTEWSKVIGSVNGKIGDNESLHGLAVNPQDGSIVVTGNIHFNPINFGGQTFAGNTSHPYLAKYDSNGIHQWSKQFGDTQNVQGWAVATDSASNILLSTDGNYSAFGTSQLDFGCGNTPDVIATNGKLIITKFSPDGSCLWSKAAGIGAGLSTRAFAGEQVLADSSNNVIVGGWYNVDYSSDGPNFGGGLLPSNPDSVVYGFLVKYSSTGSFLWSKAITTDVANSWVKISDVVSDAAGNIYATGAFNLGTVDFGGIRLTASPYIPGTSFPGDIFLAKYSASGNLIWVKQIVSNSANTDNRYNDLPKLAVDQSGNIALAGLFTGSTNIDGQPLISLGKADALIASFTPTGSLRWQRTVGDIGQEDGVDIALAPDGTLITSLTFENSLDTGASGVVASSGLSDVLVMKLNSQSGATLGARTYGGTTTDKYVMVSSDRNSRPVLGGVLTSKIALAGEIQGVQPGFNSGQNVNISDLLIANLDVQGLTGDTSQPVITSIGISPINSGVVSGSVTISALFQDNISVRRVEFFNDNDTTPYSVKTAPFSGSSSSTTFNTTSIPDGFHTFKIKAFDAAGNTSLAGKTVQVANNTLAISASFPPDGFIDALQDRDSSNQNVLFGIKNVSLSFSGAVMTPSPSDFDINCSKNGAPVNDLQIGTTPTVNQVTLTNSTTNTYNVQLSQRICLGAWTEIKATRVRGADGTALSANANRVVFGFLPMDINQDHQINGEDIIRWRAIKDGTFALPAPLTSLMFLDQNRNGVIAGEDLTRGVQLINGIGTFQGWGGFDMGRKP